MNIPSQLRYTKSHEWIQLDGDIATVGITDHAQSELGDIVFVELPAIGRVVGEHESVGSIESVKTVSDFYSPVAGEVIERNDALTSESELVNSDPYAGGWLIKIKMSGDATGLLDAEGYAKELG